jgi:hypothetical protein
MRKSSILMAAAAVAVAGMTFVPASTVLGEDSPTRQTTTGNQGSTGTQSGSPTGLNGRSADQSAAGSRLGGQAKSDASVDQRGIQDCLAKIVEDATTPGKISDLVNQISTSGSPSHAHGSSSSLNGSGSSASGGLSGTSGSTAGGSNGANSTSGSGRSSSTPGTVGSGADSSAAGGVRSGSANSSGTPGTTGTSGNATASGQAGSSDLDGKIAQLQKDWKAKYNQDFKLSENKASVFNDSFARIQSSDMGGTARTASERQTPGHESSSGATGTNSSTPRTGLSGTGSSTSGTSSSSSGSSTSGIGSSTNGGTSVAGPQTNGGATSSTGTNANGTGTASSGSKSTAGGTGYTGVNTGAASGSGSTGTASAHSGSGTSDAASTASHRTDRGDSARSDSSTKDNMAMVTIPASHNAPALNLRFVSEGGTWKLDGQKHVDQQQLQANIAKHLDMVEQMKDQWPADVNDAYRAVSHHVLMAVNETATLDHSTK